MCYLVCASLVSHELTRSWSLVHLVETTHVWQSRYRTWFDLMLRVQLGQLALRICRDHIKHGRSCPMVQDLFTDELALNRESAVVSEFWKRCEEMLYDDGPR